MKKLLFIVLILTAGLVQSFAQPTNQDTSAANAYEKMLEGQLQVSFRNYATQALGLTAQEITAFDPIFRDYMRAKDSLVSRKFRILERYNQQNQDTTAGQQAENWADAVEDYWKVEIDEMQLQRTYFDRLEDRISPQKAFSFFLLEDAVQTRLRDAQLARAMPMIIEIERMPRNNPGNNIPGDSLNTTDTTANPTRDTTTQPQGSQTTTDTSQTDTAANQNGILAYDAWARSFASNPTTNGKNLQEGLNNLAAAVELLVNATEANVTNIAARRDQIIAHANQLAQGTPANRQGTVAREAFVQIADLLKAIQAKTAAAATADSVKSLEKAAQAIKANQSLSNQQTAVKNFFSWAHYVVNKISNDIWGK